MDASDKPTVTVVTAKGEQFTVDRGALTCVLCAAGVCALCAQS
jgi:hypothetical protein